MKKSNEIYVLWSERETRGDDSLIKNRTPLSLIIILSVVLLSVAMKGCVYPPPSSTPTPIQSQLPETLTPTITPSPTLTQEPILQGTPFSPVEPTPTSSPSPANAYFFLVDVSDSVVPEDPARKGIPLFFITLMGNLPLDSSPTTFIGVGKFWEEYEIVQPIADTRKIVSVDNWFQHIVDLKNITGTRDDTTKFSIGLQNAIEKLMETENNTPLNRKVIFLLTDGEITQPPGEDQKQLIREQLISAKDQGIEIVLIPISGTRSSDDTLNRWYELIGEGYLVRILDKQTNSGPNLPLETSQIMDRLYLDYFSHDIGISINGVWLSPNTTSSDLLTIPGSRTGLELSMIASSPLTLKDENERLLSLELNYPAPLPTPEQGQLPEFILGSLSDLESPDPGCDDREFQITSNNQTAFYWPKFVSPSFNVNLQPNIWVIKNYLPLLQFDVSIFVRKPVSQWIDYTPCYYTRVFVKWQNELENSPVVWLKNFIYPGDPDFPKFDYLWGPLTLPSFIEWPVKDESSLSFYVELYDKDGASLLTSKPVTVTLQFHPEAQKITRDPVWEAALTDGQKVKITVEMEWGAGNIYEKNYEPAFYLLTPGINKDSTGECIAKEATAIFDRSGLFPPEELEWEKVFGWDLREQPANDNLIEIKFTDRKFTGYRSYEITTTHATKNSFWNEGCGYQAIGIDWPDHPEWPGWVCFLTKGGQCKEIGEVK